MYIGYFMGVGKPFEGMNVISIDLRFLQKICI